MHTKQWTKKNPRTRFTFAFNKPPFVGDLFHYLLYRDWLRFLRKLGISTPAVPLVFTVGDTSEGRVPYPNCPYKIQKSRPIRFKQRQRQEKVIYMHMYVPTGWAFSSHHKIRYELGFCCKLFSWWDLFSRLGQWGKAEVKSFVLVENHVMANLPSSYGGLIHLVVENLLQLKLCLSAAWPNNGNTT